MQTYFYLLLLLICFVSNIARGQDLEKVFSGTKPVGLSGGFSARSVVYSANNIPARRKPFSYILSGNATATVYGAFSIPFSFTYSNQDFYLSQPFNQFGMSPSYKWITVHAGFRNINHSAYTLAGHQMIGGGFELTPGNFRIGFMYGRLQRAVSEDTTLLSLRTPAYKRVGWSAKIGYGTESNFVDLIVFKAEDDESSLTEKPANANVLPGENLVLGLKARQAFFEKLIFDFDGAISNYVHDKTYSIPLEEENALLSFAENFLAINGSAQVLTALKTGLSYQEKWFGIRTYFQRIDPDYRSMGIYFVNNDLQAFNVAPTLILFENTLRLNGSLTFQRDNLLNQKAVTTRRTLPQISVSYNPNAQWGISGTYTNMSTLQQEGALPLDNALKMDQNNPIYTLSANYNITDTLRSHTFSLFANRSELNDNNFFTQEFANYAGNSFNLSYNYSHFSSGLGLYGAFNANNIETFNGNLPGTGFSVGVNKSLQENKITLNTNLSLSFQEEVNSQNFMLGANYRLNKHTFSLNMNYLNTIFQGSKYNEFTGFIEYGISF